MTEEIGKELPEGLVDVISDPAPHLIWTCCIQFFYCRNETARTQLTLLTRKRLQDLHDRTLRDSLFGTNTPVPGEFEFQPR